MKLYEFEGHRIPTRTANIILIKAPNGFLGCGYFSVETAEKLGENVALVTGVKTYDDMLKAAVVKLSAAARQAGIAAGMSGRDALLKML